MEFLRFLVFAAVWGLMWRWVLQHRGNWSVAFGHIAGVVSGFIVGCVVLSLTLSVFPSKDKAEHVGAEPGVTEAPATQKAAEPAKAEAAEHLPTFVLTKTEADKDSPDSALRPDKNNRLPMMISEQAILEKFDGDGRAAYLKLLKMAGDTPNADKSWLAKSMCGSFVMGRLILPASSTLSDVGPFKAKRFEDQIYTVSSTFTAKNMYGTVMSYRFDCSVQSIPDQQSGYSNWHQLNLNIVQDGA